MKKNNIACTRTNPKKKHDTRHSLKDCISTNKTNHNKSLHCITSLPSRSVELQLQHVADPVLAILLYQKLGLKGANNQKKKKKKTSDEREEAL
jgi:hypothetical protein